MFLVVLSMVRQHTWQTHPLAPPSPAPPPTKDFNPSSNYQSRRDFPGSPVVKTQLLMQGAQVQSLVREQGSHMLHR